MSSLLAISRLLKVSRNSLRIGFPPLLRALRHRHPFRRTHGRDLVATHGPEGDPTQRVAFAWRPAVRDGKRGRVRVVTHKTKLRRRDESEVFQAPRQNLSLTPPEQSCLL